MSWSSIKNLDLKNTWNLTAFVMVPGKNRQVGKKKDVQIMWLVKITMIKEPWKAEVAPELGFCADAYCVAGGLNPNASSVLCYCTLWGEKLNLWQIPKNLKMLDVLTQERHPPPGTDTEDFFPWILPLRVRNSVSDMTKWAATRWRYTYPTS